VEQVWLLDVPAMANERLPLGLLHGQDNSSPTNHEQGIVRDRRVFACVTSPQNALYSSTHTPKERGYQQERTHSKTLADLWGLISPQHFDDMPTIRPSDFPEADFWTTEEQTVARRELHRNLPAHIFRILPPLHLKTVRAEIAADQ
jgi:hypothetical protein